MVALGLANEVGIVCEPSRSERRRVGQTQAQTRKRAARHGHRDREGWRSVTFDIEAFADPALKCFIVVTLLTVKDEESILAALRRNFPRLAPERVPARPHPMGHAASQHVSGRASSAV